MLVALNTHTFFDYNVFISCVPSEKNKQAYTTTYPPYAKKPYAQDRLPWKSAKQRHAQAYTTTYPPCAKKPYAQDRLPWKSAR